MKSNYVLLVLVILFSIGLISANSDLENGHDDMLERAEEIIDLRTSCDELGEEGLEALGEYFMEQMHPGEAHVDMDAMMGGEGSERLRNVHVSIGVRFYCEGILENTGIVQRGMMNGRGAFFEYFIYILFIVTVVLLIMRLIKK